MRGLTRELRGAYAAFYRRQWAQGEAGACREEALKGPARRLLLLLSSASSGGSPERTPGRLLKSLRGLLWEAAAAAAAEGERGREGALWRLGKALEFLELLCVNLFLSPWRREIRALKTFTGNFVYYVRSVLPEDVVERLLEEIGYVATSATEFSLVRKLSEEEAEQAAFELFLARIECEDLLEIAEEVRDSDLGELLQKRAQRHQQPGRDLDKNHQPIQRKEYVFASGQSEVQGCHSPQETYLTHSTLAFEGADNTELRSEIGLRCPTEESQTAISKCIPEQNMTQGSPEGASSNSCIKSSDSEDFLIKYSDIVIGQKPLHLSDLSSKASANETQAMGFVEARLGPPAKGGQSLTFLSPDASGPQALAILNNDTLGHGHLYDYRTQESSRDTVESKICDAIDCLSIHGSDPTDQPKELKGNIIQHSNANKGCNFPREEETCDLFSNKKLKIKEDCAGQLMYPVEETAQMEQRTTRSGIQVFDHSTTKLANLPGGNREDFNVDLYSSPDLFCNITGCPAVGSTYNRLVVGIPVASEGEGYFRHVEEQPSSSCTVIPEISYQGGFPASLQCRRERCPLHSSFADFNTCLTALSETNPEGYVIINKND